MLNNYFEEDENIIEEFGKLRISNFLRDICRSLKNKIQKNQDLEASLMSEVEFKGQNEVVDKLDELEIIASTRLPVFSIEEVVQPIQEICESLDINIDISEQTSLIMK